MADLITLANATATNANIIVVNHAPGFLGNISVLWGILLISAVLSLVTTLVYKYITDQPLIKQCRDDTKKYQEQLKQCKGDPAKQMEIQKQMMPLQSKMMMQQMKPTLITIIPFLVIFGMLGGWYNVCSCHQMIDSSNYTIVAPTDQHTFFGSIVCPKIDTVKTVCHSATVIPTPFHFPLSNVVPGETGIGWVGAYIIFSMVFTTLFRKALKVV